MTVRSLAAAAFAAGSVASASSAAIISFNDSGLFAQFAAVNGASVATEGFDSYSGFAPEYTGNLLGVAWEARTTGFGGMYAQGGVMSTNNPGTMYFDFAGGVTGVGGQFFATDISFSFVPSTITVGLADGSGFIGLVNSASQWQGFWSNGPAITSISIQVMGSGTLYASADSISVAVIPAPGALALLGAAGLVGGRRRR